MASVQTMLKLTDGMTPALRSINKSMNIVLNTFEQMQSSSSNSIDISAIAMARQELRQADASVAKMEENIRRSENAQKSMTKSMRETSAVADGLVGKIGSMVAAYASIQTAKKVLDVSDDLTQTTARLNLMNDGTQTTQELMNMVYNSAQDARGPFNDMAGVVARFGNNAKDAFGSSAEVVAFSNLIQKQMTIAGASTQESANAMLQLSQALGSGVLRGDELNSIFEQAPNLIQSIADYLNVPIGKIRSMAADGKLSASIVKAAIFASADDINEKFESMPMTWGQLWQLIKNNALITFQPVLQQLNELANSEQFQTFVDVALTAMSMVAEGAIYLFKCVSAAIEQAEAFGQFIADNWGNISSFILPIVAAIIAVTVAQKGLNLATKIWNAILSLNPAVFIIAGIVAAITAIIFLVRKAQGKTASAVGAICVMLAIPANIVLGVVNFIIGYGIELYNFIAGIVNGCATMIKNPVAGIMMIFQALFDFLLGGIQAVAKAIDTVLRTNFAESIGGFREHINKSIDDIIGDKKVTVMEKLDASDYQLKGFDYSASYKKGSSLSKNFEDKLSEILNSNRDTAQNTYDISDYTGKLSDTVKDSTEDLKYLRDIAEKEAVNRFTAADIKIDIKNNNSINNPTDTNGIVDMVYSQIGTKLTDSLNAAAEGV